MTTPEFSRPVDVRRCDGLTMELEATEAERIALAQRFGLVRIDRLEASVLLRRKGDAVDATGTLDADLVQSCAISAEDIGVAVEEDIAFRFVPADAEFDLEEEIELGADELDEIDYTGVTFDLGEAVAQSLALAIDPFATGPDADAARAMFRDAVDSPFAALAALKPRD